MKLRSVLIIMLSTLLTSGVIGQQADPESKKILRQYVQENIVYPLEAINIHSGTLVGGIDFTADNQPEIFIINPLHNSLNREFTNVMNSLIGYFEIENVDSILFHIEFKSQVLNFKVELDKMPENIIDPITIVCAGPVAKQDLNIYNTMLGDPVDMESDDLIKVKNHISKGKYNKAIRLLNTMIERNPYIEEFYYLRGDCSFKLGDKNRGCDDFKKLKYFLKSTAYDLDLSGCENNN